MTFPRLITAPRAAAIAVATLVASQAFALPIYDSNGFSSPRFTSNASLEGQDLPGGGPWMITANSNPAAATVRPTVGVGGGQGVEVTTAPGKTDTEWYVSKPILPVSPLDTVQVGWSESYVPTTTAGLTYGPFFGVEFFDASLGTPKQIGGFGVDSTTGDLLVLINDSNGVNYAPLMTPNIIAGNSFNDYGVSIDYTNKTYSVSLNGTVLETDPFVDPTATAFTDAPIATRFVSYANEQTLNGGTAYFDNYSISVVPEPTMISAIAVFSLGLARRRR